MVHMKHPADTRKPYSGLSRSLVIAIDVGTTFSGVSYAILEPGEIPKIHGVTRFPGQEHVAGNSKIPSIIYYDKHGRIMAAGAEADSSSIVAQAEDEGWIKAELFKLRLRPRTMQLNMNGMRLTPLPKRKTPVHVFGDYLAYLYRCTRSFITDTHANGTSLWNAVESDIQFVLSHPNGWEGPQQTRMRNAAVYGGLVPDNDAGKARIRFVTEGEASLHACVLNGLADDVLSNPSKIGFLIADAGGGTLDISSYAIKGTAPLAMEEIAPPDCIFAGSVFVSRRARDFFQEKLKNSKYGTPDALDHITRRFDETTKRLFRDSREMQFVPFGSPLDKDLNVGIRNGQLKLSGNEVANLFEPSVDAAVSAIKAQIQASGGTIRSVFLVGGYAASPWLFTQLQERLGPSDVKVSRPDTQTSKAVADGAIGFYCDHHVSARMSKFMYGVEFLRELDLNNPDHERRKEKLCELPSGPKLLPDAFDCILARGVKVKESTVFTRKYCTELTNLSMLSVFEVEVWCYRGGNVVPEWINRRDDNFSTLCVVQADLSLLSGSAEPKQGKNGKKYWTIVFSVEIHFGLTEFKARMKWKDKDQTKFGPAVIVYNERGHRIEDDDIDAYPEDDISSHNNSSRNNTNSRSSRSHTPVDAHYPPGSSNSRRASAVIPDVTRIDPRTTDVSSTRSATYRGSDGERTGSDSDKRRGKEKYTDDEKDRDRGMPGGLSPIERTTSNGLGSPPITKVGSTRSAIGGGETLSSNWNPPPASTSRSPSIKPPHSRAQSIHGGDGDHNSAYGSRPPKSAVDEHRQSHLWDNSASPISPRSAALDAILDRPKSGYGQIGDHSRSHTPLGGSRPRTPVTLEPPVSGRVTPGITRSNTPFIDRPKSGIEGSFFDRPKSAFGGGSIYGDSGPAMFGDSGPAADIGAGAGTSLFGDPPASVFGDAHAGESGQVNDGWVATEGEEAHAGWDTAKGEEANDSWGGGPGPEGVIHHLGDTVEGGAGDNWNMPEATTDNAEVPAEVPAEVATITTPSTGKKGKNKRKNSTAISVPASGLASRASPAPSTKKSPLGNTPDTGFYDDSATTFLAADTTSAVEGSGLWGSKVPSPRPLSPLNPASQIDNDPSATVRDEFESGFDTAGGTGGETSHKLDLNDASLGDNPAKTPSRAPSPIPAAPEEPAVTEKAIGKGKKKKKGSTATTPAKSPHVLTQEAADKEEEERARVEKERLAAEAAEADRLAAAETDRLAAEAAEADRLAAEAAAEAARLQEQQEEQDRAEKERAEHERLELERIELEKADQEKAEKERVEQERLEQEWLAQEEKDKAAAAAAAAAAPVSTLSDPPSLFSGGLLSSSSLNPPDKPWMTTDTGGGDDSWSLGWGATTAGGKKKSKLGATSKPSAFGSWGGGIFGETTPAETIPPAEESSQDAAGLFSFSSATPNLSFGFGDSTKPTSRAASPTPPLVVDEATPTPAEIEANPTDVVSPTAETGDNGAGEEGGFETAATTKSKKKKKKGANNTDELPKEDPPVEPLGVWGETPAETEANPTDAVGPTAEKGDNDAAGEEEGFGTTVTTKSSKKKKKKGGNNIDAGAGTELPGEDPLADLLGVEEETPAETPVVETPTTGSKKKKKGKK